MSTSSLIRSPKPSENTALYASGGRTAEIFDAVLACASQRAQQYELQLKELEEKLSEDLSNCRAIESLLRDSVGTLKYNYRRADKEALRTHIPHINSELQQSMTKLTELEMRLPEIRTQVDRIRTNYDTGRQKAQQLVLDLDWLNTDFYERWRTIIFTSQSPVSWRWKAIMRILFAICFAVAAASYGESGSCPEDIRISYIPCSSGITCTGHHPFLHLHAAYPFLSITAVSESSSVSSSSYSNPTHAIFVAPPIPHIQDPIVTSFILLCFLAESPTTVRNLAAKFQR
ncbi:hypothetical protein EW146_g3104 [Bondarzewia mesenterica]|uniref:Uncharacterized protein n=1 Tax=Bondarzewia mesenterica TaxID=1095465 RepID=A0A4S4M052_9AGAM|nr:hypothetical protein EW146_g3104 [Bondarzewia mesenterica]